jgi:aminoglycoside phosphotransferase (APT) family kinase protein
MPDRRTIEAFAPCSPEHPAVKAWRDLGLGTETPHTIEILKQSKKRAVYRLKGLAVRGASVVAKRCQRDIILLERTMYEQALRHLPFAAPVYYGVVDEAAGDFSWLFLEDVGDERYSVLDSDHRLLAAHWLAMLHTTSAVLPQLVTLPARGHEWYLQHLRSARRRISEVNDNPALQPDDVAVLDRIVSQIMALESKWEEIEQLCHEMPRTLVHGDFQAKNVRVRAQKHGKALVAFDWVTAGVGIPAPDLENVDSSSYVRFASEAWPFLNLSTLERWACAGRLFRTLASIDWTLPWLAFEWHEKPMIHLRIYSGWLAEACAVLVE